MLAPHIIVGGIIPNRESQQLRRGSHYEEATGKKEASKKVLRDLFNRRKRRKKYGKAVSIFMVE